MEEQKEKLNVLISTMESEYRKNNYQHNNWLTTSRSLLEGVFNMDTSSILEKNYRYVCFTFYHEKECDGGEHTCNCSTPFSERHIKVFFFSPMFAKMISVLHSQLYFSSNTFGQLRVSLNPIELINIYNSVIECLQDSKHANAYDKEFEKEQSPDFKKNRDEFNSLICEYVRLAFTDPTSLPPFLLDPDEGPTMLLSKLDAWLESK